MKSQVVKRSVVLDGHKTSITLEDAFWSILKEIAQAEGATVSQTITEIDKSRQGGNLPDPPVRTRPGPFTKSGGHRRGTRQPQISAARGEGADAANRRD
jgi:Ribbon-helix-helix domain